MNSTLPVEFYRQEDFGNRRKTLRDAYGAYEIVVTNLSNCTDETSLRVPDFKPNVDLSQWLSVSILVLIFFYVSSMCC